MAQKAVAEVAVVVTKTRTLFKQSLRYSLLAGLFLVIESFAAVLPEERADLMYHSYDGGGVTIDGPSLLIRKNFEETFSISANYYVDRVSSASIDVTTSGASRYTEERTEYSISSSYLSDKSILSAGFTSSDENDYQAETFFFNISQDVFGDLTTVSLSYSRGNDTVKQNGNDNFQENITKQNYQLGISQILTPNLIVGINYESVSDEGFLNNPYRNYRYFVNALDPSAGYQLAQEVYPQTHTSDALSLRAAYYLPYRAAFKIEYRYFTDDWGIKANNYRLTYTHPFRNNWIFDINYRFYQQNEADFYADIFQNPSNHEKDYRARDKELSHYNTETIGIALSYQLPQFSHWVERSKISLQWDHIAFNYDNFTDLSDTGSITGSEPLYEFDADVLRFFISLWY